MGSSRAHGSSIAKRRCAAMQSVRDVMTTNVVYLPGETTLAEAARTMREQDIGDVVVADGSDLAGVVTDRDIVVRGVAEKRDPDNTTLREIMTEELVTVRPDDSIQQAALLMRDRAVRRVLVLDENGLVGIVSI